MSEVKSIVEINSLGKEIYATTFGKKKCFKASNTGRYYEACPTFHRSTTSTDCTHKALGHVTKYKVAIEVEFENDAGCFVLWDKDCIPLVQIIAANLREIMKPVGDDHPKIYPTHLDKLLNQELAFIIKYQPFFKQYYIVMFEKDQ